MKKTILTATLFLSWPANAEVVNKEEWTCNTGHNKKFNPLTYFSEPDVTATFTELNDSRAAEGYLKIKGSKEIEAEVYMDGFNRRFDFVSEGKSHFFIIEPNGRGTHYELAGQSKNNYQSEFESLFNKTSDGRIVLGRYTCKK